MKIKRPYSIVLPMLLVAGMLLLWIAASIDTRTANTVSFSCEEMVENELEEDARKDFLAGSLPDGFIIEIESVCFMRFLCTFGPSNTGNSSGWIMPLRI